MSETISKLIKRSGEIVDFDQSKIVKAIYKAAVSVEIDDHHLAKKLGDQVVMKINKKFHKNSIPAVEEIQDIVEEVLIENKLIKIAKAYIIYRDQHRQLRDINTATADEKLMEDYLGRADWRLKENSNMSFSVQGLNNYIASSISARYWLNKMYPENIRQAHVNGDMHIHDLGLLAPYCCGWDLKDLLIRGFKGVNEKVQSLPPKHFRSALGQIINFFYTMQGEAAGAQAFANFDTYLAPFIRYDNLSYKEVKQGLQEFMFNINVPTRVGFQTPFTNITLDVTPSPMIGEESVIIGGQPMPEKYKDFQPEMDMFNQAFAEVMLAGDSTGRVFGFPIPTYCIDKTFDYDRECLKPVWEMTAKYGIPYFANFVNSDMQPEDARSMCCRLRLDNRELRSRGGGLFGANPLTGSIGVVTINLPRLAFMAKDEKNFFDRLNYLMDISRDSLETKRKVLENFTRQNLYPYTRHYLRDIFERNGKYWVNHFSTIGLVGMNEACLNLFKYGIETEQGKDFAKRVLDHMRERIIAYQEETGNLYNLEATPAEGVSYRFARADREEFGNIITAGENEPYYTNSVHLPVNHTDDIFEILDHQDDLQTKFTGGTVVHCFIGEQIDDPSMAKQLVKKIAENYRLPYFTLTPTFSICPVHGYIPGTYKYCPHDHSESDLEQFGIDVKESDQSENRRVVSH